ncbi:MAG: hypothetical protein AAB358_03745 [Patescibacteria group bacterium]
MSFFKIKQEKKSEVMLAGILTGIIEVCYIFLVGYFIMSANALFPAAGNTIFAIVTMLTLLVISVVISGVLVFGLPVYYFIQKKNREIVWSLVSTFATIFVLFVGIIFCLLFLF